MTPVLMSTHYAIFGVYNQGTSNRWNFFLKIAKKSFDIAKRHKICPRVGVGCRVYKYGLWSVVVAATRGKNSSQPDSRGKYARLLKQTLFFEEK